MKTNFILALIVLFIPFQGICNPAITGDKDYIVVRVTYSTSKKGIQPEMLVDFGNNTAHPLFGKIENAEKGSLKFTLPDGSVKIAVTETELLNYFHQLGYSLFTLYSTTVLSHDYIHYILVKE